jgi:hypothetical protein
MTLATDFRALVAEYKARNPDPQQIPRPLGARPIAVPTLDEYTDALASMDWWWDRSDDYSVYRAGSDAWHRLVAMKRLVDADGEIWRQWAPEGFQA